MKLQLTITKDRPDMNISANAISREYELSFSKANIVLHLNNDFNYATKEWVQSQNFLNKDATAKNSSKLGGYEAKHYMRGRYVGNSNPNLNTQLETGIYRYNKVAGWNAPEGSTDYGNLMVIRGGDQDTLTQIYFNHDDDRVFLRSGSTSNAFATYIANQSWKEIAFKSAIPTLVSQLQNDAGYIKNLTSLMVSSALGYIPADSSQVTKTKLKQTLGISDWALEPIPPICSWNDILDKPDNIGSGSGAIDTETAEKLKQLSDKFDSMFEIDTANNAIKAKKSLYSEGSISALGLGIGGSNSGSGSGGTDSGSGSTGGGVSYSRLDSWDEYHPNNATYVLSAYLGNDLNTRLRKVENGGYITSSALNGYATQDWVNGVLMDYALASDIPSLTGYATQNWVTRELGLYAKSIDVPTNNNQLINGAGYISSVTASMVKNALGYTPLSTTGTAANSNQLGGRTADQYMVSRFSPSHKDINQTLDVGIYRFDTLNNPPKLADGTVVGTNYGNLMVIRGGGQDTLTQIYFNWDNQATYIRSGNTSGVAANGGITARSWNEIAYRSHIPTKLSQLEDDMVAGHYLPLTGGSLSGSLSVPSITIGGITISVGKDGALQINGNMYATGSITAKKIA